MASTRLVFALAVMLAACSSQPRASAPPAAAGSELAVHPVSGLQIVPLTVTHGNKRHRFTVEIARTGDEQKRGLMFRSAMRPNEGMVFPFSPPRADVAFWMRNTVIPLDIIFIGTDRRILNIAANTTPYSLDQVPAAGVTAAVLEINGGRAAELGIAPGDKVEW